MAKTTTTTKTPTAKKAETPTSSPFRQLGKFSITLDVGTPIPEAVRAPSPNALPFKSMFEDLSKLPRGTGGFLGKSWWLGAPEEGGRGIEEKAFNKTGYVKTKIRDAFNGWVKQDLEERSKYALLVVARKAGEPRGEKGDDAFEEDGHSIYVQAKA